MRHGQSLVMKSGWLAAGVNALAVILLGAAEHELI